MKLFESIEMEKPTYRGVANTEKNLIDKFGISFSDIMLKCLLVKKNFIKK